MREDKAQGAQPAPFHYPAFRFTDAARVAAIVRAFPLALVVSESDGVAYASHIPLMWPEASSQLVGHTDARNPQFCGVDSVDARLFFCGPQSYVPTDAYVTRQLPTWNYVSAHLTARIDVVNAPAAKLDILAQMAALLDGSEVAPAFAGQEERVRQLLSNITGLRIHIQHQEARIKLSQDKSPEDQRAALDHLLAMQGVGARSFLESLMDGTAGGENKTPGAAARRAGPTM